MSSIAHGPTTSRPKGIGARGLLVVGLIVLVIAATVAIVLSSSSSKDSSSPAPARVTQTSGPNEAARGQAVATAAGATSNSLTPGVNGPNETSRGQAAASASQH